VSVAFTATHGQEVRLTSAILASAGLLVGSCGVPSVGGSKLGRLLVGS
jgi:hypothetical protein